MDLLKYHNHMNDVSFNGFSEKELNLFFSLIFLAKEKGVTKLVIPFSELKELAVGDKNRERFLKNLENVNSKLIKLGHRVEIGNKIHIFSLFNVFTIDQDTDELIVQVNEIFSYMLNDLVGNFTKFDLIEFVSLKSAYSKNMFKLLKQWESARIKEFKINDFRDILNIPQGFTMSKINERVLNPILMELSEYFPNLKLEKIKTGRSVTSLKFTWNRKNEKIEPKKVNNVIDIIEIEISEKLNQAIEKAKKNRFIEKLLTIDNIEILTQMFQENDLIKGLLWAYKEVRQDISTLNYLIKTIRTGAEKKEKKIVVKKSEEKQEDIFNKTFEEIPLNFEKENSQNELVSLDQNIEPQKITKEEYENLYKIYLKENNIRNLKSVRKGFDLSNKSKYKVVEDEPQEKIYHADELPKEKLLSKSGKELKGMPLLMRLRKLAKDMQISIQYKDEIIKGNL
ncbi:MAG: replication initiation protein [Bacilli bacterium]